MDYLEMEREEYEKTLREVFECSECGKSMDKDTDVCSGACFEASML